MIGGVNKNRAGTGAIDAHRSLLPALWAAVLLAAFAAPLCAQPDRPFPDRVESATLPAHIGDEGLPLKPRNSLGAPRAHSISIGRVSQEQALAETSTAARPGTPRKIGFSRAIPELASPAGTANRLKWQSTPQGTLVAAISVTSPPATGVRLGILVRRLPAEAILRFYRQGAANAYEISGREILETIKRNLDAGDKSDEARTFWSPHVEGEEVTLEIELPSGMGPDVLEIAIPRVSHFFSFPPARQGGNVEKIGQSGLCEIDVSCYPAWINESNATADMVFVDSGVSYECTGTLLNNRASNFTPYFLSANHCISNQTVASTLMTYWFYRSTACNSGVVNPANQIRTGGATLLYASSVTDTSFMQLRSAPPSGASYAGWLPSASATGTSVVGIHHPKGDLQKISLGSIQSYQTCTGVGPSGTFSCFPAGNGNFINVIYASGITEGGSSGSGLFATVGGSHYLIGQLRGGDSSCSNPGGDNEYGRFDLAYSAALYQWLDAGITYKINVVSNGGTVGGTAGGQSISCTDGSGICSASGLASGAAVSLTATPSSGNGFSGWSGGACSGTGTCAFSMGSSDVSVVANFAPLTPTCTLTATPASIAAGASSTLTANCSPAATSYAWSINTGFASTNAGGTVTPGTTTTYVVAGINGAGTGPSVSVVVTVMPPPAPTITGVSRNYGRAVFSFTTPAFGGSPITSYTVTCTAAGQATRSAPGASSPITVEGLAGGVPYSCAVTASNGIAASAPSAVMPVIPQSVVPMMKLLLFDD